MPTLFESFAGNVNFIGTQKTLRTQADGGNSCAVTNAATSATLAGLPAGATVVAAYLYWAGSGDTPDYDVTFEGNPVSADPARRYTATFTLGTDYRYFSGVADVSAVVAVKGNGSYSFSGLNADTGDPWCGSSAVVAGWALLVVYSHASEDFRVVNVYEGFQHFRGSDITLNPSNFLVPASPINGKNAHLTWEGDPGNSAPLNGFTERLTFNGNVLSDASNPVDNQFNSVSSINSDATAYGVDFDAFDISAYLSAGQTSATTVYSSGGDLVLLSAQVISTTNTPAADLASAMTRNGALVPGQNATYTLGVTNHGPLDEPGSITVVDTLPAGLGFVSASGTGWSCGAVGQVVTCSRAGSLSSGASADAISLTVAVSAGATGAVTNTATVDGSAFDNDASNDTATDTYAFLPAAYAYYAMDDTTWGAVIDSSGNGRDGTAIGAAAPSGYPPASPPGSAISGSPGTCGAGAFPATAGSGVDTGIDVNSLGDAGTIAFWYSSNTDWDDGNDRMLFDASNNLGNANADKHFYLVKGDRGELRFGLEDDDDDDELISTGRNSFAANEWHHVAVTWDWGSSNRIRLYLDGVEEDNTGINDAIANYATLHLGIAHSGIQGTDTDFTTNTANGYLDEVRIFSGALSQADIQAVMNATHSCIPFDHIRIEHGSGTGLTCNPSTLTIRACADATCSTFYTGGVTGDLTATGSPTVNFVGGPTFTISPGSSSVTKNVHVTTPGSLVFGTNGVSPVPGGAVSPICNFGLPSCTFTAADSGFIFDVPNHTADTVQNVVLSAVRTDDATQRCVPAFQGVNQTVSFWSTYLDPNTGTQAVSVNGANVAGASPGSSRNLSFDANGQATIQVRYPDVGRVRLLARHTGSGDASGLVMTGQDDFVAKPSRFVLTVPGNAAASDPSGGVFRRAGENFQITVEARNASDAVTPNYGRESAAEAVKFATQTLVAPAGGNNPPLNGSFGAFGRDCSGNPAAPGTACGTFSWSEVGILALTPSVGDDDYLGAGNVVGTASGNIGRFRPDHYAVITGPQTVINHACAAGAFTYARQPFTGSLMIEARNSSGVRTQNFRSGYDTLAPDELVFINGATGAAYDDKLASFKAGSGFSDSPTGQAELDLQFRWDMGQQAPTTSTVQLAGSTDEVNSVNGAPVDIGSTSVRLGRLAFTNAYGSELMDLPLPLRAQYYAGATTGFVTNAADTCTTIAVGSLSLANGDAPSPVPDPGPKAVGSGSTNASFVSPLAGGDAGLVLSAPGSGGTGYVDVTANLAAMPWLQYDWDNNGAHDNNPSGRASFGIYRGSPRQIYRREVFR